LYVPKGSVELYRVAEQWKEFSNIEGVDMSGGIDEIEMGTGRALLARATGDGIEIAGTVANEDISIYDIAGTQVYAGKTSEGTTLISIPLARGHVYIIRIAGQTVKGVF